MISYGRQNIDKKDVNALIEVLESDFLTTGPKVGDFEKALCKYTGAKHAVAVSSGTAALHLVSIALLRPGDKVLTTPNSFVATSNAILYAGAKPIFVDIDEYGNIDLDQCIALLEQDRNIKALYGVHFSGKPLDMQKLRFIKEQFGIVIVEDAAHALGAKYEEGKIGDCCYSDAVIFSFHPVKAITTGEGGAIMTNSEELSKKLKTLRNHGITKENFINHDMAYDSKGNLNPWYYELQESGYNYRITDIQCALGLSQLEKLDSFIQKRQEIAKRYDEVFINMPIRPLYPFDTNSAYHLYVVHIDFSKLTLTKADLFYAMQKAGIALQVHYIPINKQPLYRSLGYGSEKLPQMDRYYEEAFSLPIYPTLTYEEQNYVIDQLLKILDANTKR